LKNTQRAILAQLKRSPRVTVGVLAAALVMDAGALAHTLKPLERDGLLEISVDANDRRNRLIELSPAGHSKLAETDVLWAAAEAAFQATLGKARSQPLREALMLLISDKFLADFEEGLVYAGPKF
jgi:DNA-binding MarR family transcriptional regulator